ncbi:uncharacterized protein [Montipora capricornis]|uniref:uncharacterized protein n=1 Tax=Montipora capricornis TaxID=246305 RepID=UPI0035F1B101
MEWTVEEVRQKIQQKYNKDIAKKFEEENIDGKALAYLAKEGTAAQFSACGLTTVGEQLLLKELISELPVAQIPCRRNKKPTVQEIKALSEMTQRIYKVKRKAVTDATTSKWPGFNVESIKQHILDVLNERRRRHRSGHDYNKRCVPIPAAKVIVQVAFNAIGFKDVAKHQLISCIKKYSLKPAKETQNLDKEKAAQIVASYLLDNEIVHSNSGKELKHITRADIIKRKAF